MIDPYTLGYWARACMPWNPYPSPLLALALAWITGFDDACADIEPRAEPRLEPECRPRVER